ncbi:hypothetical protein DY023_11475 [Microbacterium bovistercoris]|uniref:Uncharacterized protein n=1 Tax=Microbacterium bovistercoris TaxID=2293570 RepID=A0A371NSP7_9MICO|nr:hypothetical protein [Microbacterium bovistercoris]REJ05184.1 hypothetical protein DY023_11475 [Microbacterium bovistercoris]
MGLFQQRPDDEQKQWAGLPSEPLDTQSAAEQLDTPPTASDLFGVAGGPLYTTVVFPVAPPAPEAADVAANGDGNGEGDGDGDE